MNASSKAKQVSRLPPSEQEAWVRAVNGRWLVRSDLRENACDYLDSLATMDPDRLRRTTRIVLRMMETAPDGEDPKPRFYAALFSLANRDERTLFLANHHFTQMSLPSGDAVLHNTDLAPETLEKLATIRKELQALLEK